MNTSKLKWYHVFSKAPLVTCILFGLLGAFVAGYIYDSLEENEVSKIESSKTIK